MDEVSEYCLVTDNGTFREKEYEDEHELERLAVAHVKELFTDNALYFDVKKRVTSKIRPRVTDGLLLDFREKNRAKFWIVEYETHKHDMESTVAPQLRGFLKALKDETTLRELGNTIYEEIKTKPDNLKRFRELAGVETDIHYLIDQVLHEEPGILVVIDDIDEEGLAVLEDMSPAPYVIPFRTFQKDGKLIHYTNPLTSVKSAKRERRGRIRKGDLLPRATSWDARLEWVQPSTKQLTAELIKELATVMPGTIHKPRFRWYEFYRREPLTQRNRVAVILISGKGVRLSIRVDPSKFSDPHNLARTMKGFFFPKGTERRLAVTTQNLDEAVSLAQSAYRQTW